MGWSLVAGSGAGNTSLASPYTVTLGAACLIGDRVIVSAMPPAIPTGVTIE